MRAFILFFAVSIFFSADFKSIPIVSLQGNNNEYDFANFWNYEENTEKLYMCFLNSNNNIYSVCVKQIVPMDTTIIIISSDGIPKQNPSISINAESTIRIVWQEERDNIWQLFSKEIKSDSLTNTIQLTNTKGNNTSPQLGRNSLVWVSGEKLQYAQMSDSLNNVTVIDTGLFFNPDLMGEYCSVIYQEKASENQMLIKQAFFKYSEQEWKTDYLTQEGYSINPRYTSGEESFTYQSYDSIWHSYLAMGDSDYLQVLWSTDKIKFNIENPYYFSYPTIAQNSAEIRDWFIVYETDSIPQNKEIFLEFFPESEKGKMNISSLPGDDIKPISMQIMDSVAVVWENKNATGSQIYWAKEKFRCYGAVDDLKIFYVNDFSLSQNYPNPFNPQTTIEFNIPKTSEITLEVYNILGELVKVLVDRKIHKGNFKMVWDGTSENGCSVSSGVYFYTLKYGNQKLSKKMLLVR